MNKRIRKKKHKGEYQCYCVDLVATIIKGFDVDKFWDDYIEAVENNNCLCGGGIVGNTLDMTIDLGIKMNNPLNNKDGLENWLKNDERIESYNFGDIIDGWYEYKIKV